MVEHLEQMANDYMSGNVMFMWGDDMRFFNAKHDFEKMERVMQYIREHYKHIELKFATVSEYFNAVKSWANRQGHIFPMIPLEAIKGDFFPYVDSFPFDFWSGFYSLRPGIKSKIKQAEANLKAMETLFMFSHDNSLSPTNFQRITQGRRSVALVQHHDAITGTHANAVANDYENILNHFHDESSKAMETMIGLLVRNMTTNHNVQHFSQGKVISISEKETTLILYNTLSWSRSEYVEIAVDSEYVSVFDTNGNEIQSQMIPRFSKKILMKPMFSLIFCIEFPPFSLKKIILKQNVKPMVANFQWIHNSPHKPILIKNNYYQIAFNGETGSLLFVNCTNENEVIRFSQNYLTYLSLQNSFFFNNGIYIFRVNWGIWMLIGLGIGLCTGALVAYVYHTIMIVGASEYFQFLPVTFRRLFLRYKVRISKTHHCGLHMYAIAVTVTFAICHICFQLVSEEWYHYIMNSTYTFGIPIGTVFGFVVTLIGGWKRIITFLIVAFVTYISFIAAYPNWIARSLMQPNEHIRLLVVRGPIVHELHQFICSSQTESCSIHQTIRLYRDKKYIENDNWIEPRDNQDIVTRFKLHGNVGYQSEFWTDANNLWMMKRNYKHLLPIQGSYYPVTSTAILESKKHTLQVFTSQPLGTTSFGDSSLEFQLHRQPLSDDERGLGSPIYEYSSAQIRFRIQLFSKQDNKQDGRIFYSLELQKRNKRRLRILIRTS